MFNRHNTSDASREFARREIQTDYAWMLEQTNEQDPLLVAEGADLTQHCLRREDGVFRNPLPILADRGSDGLTEAELDEEWALYHESESRLTERYENFVNEAAEVGYWKRTVYQGGNGNYEDEIVQMRVIDAMRHAAEVVSNLDKAFGTEVMRTVSIDIDALTVGCVPSVSPINKTTVVKKQRDSRWEQKLGSGRPEKSWKAFLNGPRHDRASVRKAG